jgi:hypothetical protein
MGPGILLPGVERPECEVKHHLRGLRMSGVIHPLRMFVFGGCIGKALPLATANLLETASGRGSLIRSGKLWEPREASVKADSHIACRAHAVPLPCRAAKGLECVFPMWFTQCDRVWFTLVIPCPCHALTMSFFSSPRHSTAVERRPVGYLPSFGFFRLPLGVPQRLLSGAYQSSSQRSIPTTVKSGSRALQKRRSVKLLD